jgi:hypothetical protein
MKRRKSLLLFGGLISSNFIYNSKYINQPVMAVSYEDFITDETVSIDTTSGEIGSVLIKFNQFYLEGRNIKDEDSITVRINAEINNTEKQYIQRA